VAESLETVGERLGVAEYQIVALGKLLQRTSLAGKRVLEVGGSNLPRELTLGYLGAKEWIAVDIIENDSYELELQRAHYEAEGINDLSKAAELFGTKPYLIFNGAIENAAGFPSSYFDIVISITSLEHVLAMPSALATIQRLKSGSAPLFSYHGPIWSSRYGHHVWVDAEINFNNPEAIPAYDHLLCSPPEMFEKLTARYGSARAEQTVLQMYHSPRINRLFYEDYCAYFALARFGAVETMPYGEIEVSERLQAKLETRHPGYREFSAYGMIAFLR
jgi:hypothetical protein